MYSAGSCCLHAHANNKKATVCLQVTVYPLMGLSRPRFNFLNVNTGSDLKLVPISLWCAFAISPAPDTHTHKFFLLQPQRTPHSNTRNTDPVPDQPSDKI